MWLPPPGQAGLLVPCVFQPRPTTPCERLPNWPRPPTEARSRASAWLIPRTFPLQFLEHILLDLKHAGIVRARRGAKGGYWLAKPADEVSIADVIRAVEGPIAHVQSAPPESISYTGSAKELQNVWIAVRASLREVLESTSLEDLVSGNLPDHVRELADDKDAWQPR